MLKFLKLDQVNAIITAAETLRKKLPPERRAFTSAENIIEDLMAYGKKRKPVADLVSALSHDARMELMALMWIGRDFDGDFNQALAFARQNTGDGDIDYVVAKWPALPTYLRNGLERVGINIHA